MSGFQRYLFLNVLKTLLAFVGGLAMIALLTQGLSQIELIVENHQTMLTYLWVSVLAAPQIVALLLPIALFFATCWGLNRLHRDNEVVVAQASGMSNRGVASPILRLATLAAILHLGLTLWVQPAAFREMRATVSQATTDLASQLVKQGAFTSHDNGLTTFARQVNGNEMLDLIVDDKRDPNKVVTYIAKFGLLSEQEGKPIIVMRDGHAETVGENGSLEMLNFTQSVFELAPFIDDQRAVILKESDRYLPELFFPDLTNYYDRRNKDLLQAEGHARIAAPLLNIAMAIIAIYAVLGGDFSRRGYSRRIAIASGVALFLRLLAFGAQSAAKDDPDLNALQYAVPLLAIAIVSFLFFVKPALQRRIKARRPPPGQRRIPGAVEPAPA
jgi:lipopolysaccharide export system permease protein